MAYRDPFRALADNAAEAIVTIDEADRIVYANPAASRMFGYSPAELAGLPFTELLPERFRERHRAGLARYIATGARRLDWSGVELSGLRRDGSEMRLEVTFGEYADGGERRFTGVMRDVTERRAREERERATTETLEALVRGAPLAVIGLTDDGRVELWSPSAERIFGWSAEEVRGRPLPIVPEDRADEHEALFGRAAGGETVQRFETVRRRKDGSLLDVNVSVAPLVTASGEIRGVMGMYEDVTVIKETDRARTRSENRVHFLAEAGRLLASSLDPDGALRMLARLAVPHVADWCAIYLVEDGQLRLVEVAHRDPARVETARRMRELYPPHPDAPGGVWGVVRSGRPELVPEVTDAMLRDAAVDSEHLRLLHELRLGSALTVPLYARGATIGAISLISERGGRRFGEEDLEFATELAARAGLALDNGRLFVQAERRAEEEAALRQATEQVAASTNVDQVIHAIAAGALVACDADGAFVERITGSAETVEVAAVHGSLTPDLGEAAPLAGSFAEVALRERRPVPVPDTVQGRSAILNRVGERCGHCSALVLPLQDGGEPLGDLVLLRRAEEGAFSDREIGRAATFAHLASLAFRRLHLLHETEQRKQELERVSESRARLVRGFSHDVKNPLGAADGHLELLEESILGPLQPKQADSVRRARAAIRSALDLIGDLVELARAEATVVDIERGPTDVAALAREVAEEHRASAEKKGLGVAVEPGGGPIIESDPSRARQILGNLLSNAIKYTDRGSVRVRVESMVGDGGGRGVAVHVIDSGRGIPAEKRHLLFQEFGRIARDREGMGLGLAISRRLARALGGDILVDSEPGRGSTFTLWLPMERREPVHRVA